MQPEVAPAAGRLRGAQRKHRHKRNGADADDGARAAEPHATRMPSGDPERHRPPGSSFAAASPSGCYERPADLRPVTSPTARSYAYRERGARATPGTLEAAQRSYQWLWRTFRTS